MDKNYLEDTLKMVKFLKKKRLQKGSSNNSPRSGIFKPEYCSKKMKLKLEKYVIQKIWKKTKNNKKLLEKEKNKMQCLMEVTQNLNMMIQKKEVVNMLMCLELFLDILFKNEYYYITRKGMLISIKVFFTLEEFDKCSEIIIKLLNFASIKRDYSCLVACWMRLAECHSCLLYTSPSPRDLSTSRMPSSA